MAEPIRCAGCGRHYNPSFKRCPFCNAAVGSSVAVAAIPSASTQVLCPACRKSFSARLPRCPFCNAVRDESAIVVSRGDPPPRRPTGPMPAVSVPPLPDFVALAEEAITNQRHQLALEYHVAAICALDVFLDHAFGERGAGQGSDEWRPSPAERAQIVSLGALFGEILRRDFGGTWQPDPEQPGNVLATRVALPGGLSAVPLSKVWRRFQNGADDNLEQLHRSVRAHLGRVPGPPEIPGWVRQARFFRSVGRHAVAAQFLRRAIALGPDPSEHKELLRELAECEAAQASQELAAASEAPPARVAEAPPSPEADAPLVEVIRSEEAAPAQALGPPAVPRPAAPAPSGPVVLDGPRGLLERAARLLANGRNAEALTAFERALALTPSSDEALLGVPTALLACGRAREARTFLESVAVRPSCEPARTLLLARVADELGDAVTACAAWNRCRAASALTPEQRAAAAARADQLEHHPAVLLDEVAAIEDPERRLATILAHCEAHPEVADLWRERGVALALRGDDEEAIRCFERAASLAADEPRSYDHHAVLLARQGRYDEALAVLERGLAARPGAAELLARKAVMLLHLQRAEEALASLEAAVAADPESLRAWAWKGDVEAQLDRREAALASLDRALALPPHADVRLVEAARQQRFVLAHRVGQRDPEMADRCLDDAIASAVAGDAEETLRHLDAALSNDPLRGDAWENRGKFLEHLGRLPEAIESYRRADELAVVPTANLEAGLCRCLLSLGRGDEALEVLARSAARGAFRVETQRLQARTLVALGRPGEALPIYLKLLARAPQDPELGIERAEALAASGGRRDEAEQAFRAALALVPETDEALGKRARDGLAALLAR